MQPTDVIVPAPAPAAAAEPRRAERDEIRKPSFWISQLFILAATVCGVYLAAGQGFKQAIAYGDIQTDRNNYYLRQSLRGEIADNIEHVRGYMERLKTGGLPARKAPFALDTYVWENMKYSQQTLETPPELLRECRRFYRGVVDIQVKIADNTYSAQNGIDRLQALIEAMEKDVLPLFDADAKTLRASLASRGIKVK